MSGERVPSSLRDLVLLLPLSQESRDRRLLHRGGSSRETFERNGQNQNGDDGLLRRTMTQVKLPMPTMNDDEEDWMCYIGAIKIASQRLGINMGRSRQESLHMAWQVHRLAMSVMSTGVWKKYPSLKKLVWSIERTRLASLTRS